MQTEKKIDIHHRDLKAIIKKLDNSDVSKKNITIIKKFLEEASIGNTSPLRRRAGRICHEKRLIKLLYTLKVISSMVKKDLDKLKIEDIKSFLKKLDKKDYEDSTKADYKKILIKFLRWKLGETKEFHELTDWIGIDIKKKEVPFLKEEDINKLISACKTIKQRLLISFLFDSGARIEEFLNVRIGDLTRVKSDLPYYKVTIRAEWSKTAGRTIGLYWKKTTSLIDEWLKLHPNKDDNSAPLYPSTYDGCRSLLYKIALRSLGKKINLHLLRHSSATYYASRLNRFQLCKRYGWSFSSDMPSVYIGRAGVEEDKIAEELRQERQKEILEQLEGIREQNKALRDADKTLAEQIGKFVYFFNSNPKFKQIKKQKEFKELINSFS